MRLYVLCVLVVAIVFNAPISHAQKRHKVGILGAGLAGIRAATVLESYGVHDWVILESSKRIGGRLLPISLDGVTIEAGANWIEGTTGNIIYDIAEEMGLRSTYQDWDSVVYYNRDGSRAKSKHVDDLYENIEKAFNCTANSIGGLSLAFDGRPVDGADTSLSRTLAECGWAPGLDESGLDSAIDWWENDFEWAQSTSQTSTAATQPGVYEVDFEERDKLVVDSRGYAEVARYIADKYLSGGRNDSRILYNKHVVQIDAGNANLTTVTSTDDGAVEIWDFDAVICTFSVGVLQHDFHTLFKKTKWEHERKRALFEISMGTYMKTFLKFPKGTKFLENKEFVMKASERGPGHFPLWQNLDMPGFLPGESIMFNTVTGAQAKGYEIMSNKELESLLLEQLRKLYPKANIPKPVARAFPRWSSHKLFRGSYSNRNADFDWNDFRALDKPLGSLYISGEAMCWRMFAYVPSAYLTGERSALRVLRDVFSIANVTDPDDSNCMRKPAVTYGSATPKVLRRRRGSSRK